jgi:hypothetical protein
MSQLDDLPFKLFVEGFVMLYFRRMQFLLFLQSIFSYSFDLLCDFVTIKDCQVSFGDLLLEFIEAIVEHSHNLFLLSGVEVLGEVEKLKDVGLLGDIVELVFIHQ